MPTKRRRIGVRRRGRVGELTRQEVLYLWSGFNLIDGSNAFEGASRDDLRRAYQEHRAQVLDSYVETFPGTRPWAWWQFEAPKRRKAAYSPDFLCELREPESLYLYRCGLMTAKEEAAIERAGFAPIFADEAGYWERATKGGEPKPVSRFVWQARKRNAEDREKGPARGLWYDEEAADFAVAACNLLFRHSKGAWANKPFRLSAWQEHDLIRPVLGWKKLPPLMTAKEAKRIPFEDRLGRGIVLRFKKVYNEMARKQGKSTLLAIIGWIFTACMREWGGEVYVAATKRDQAKRVHEEAVNMREKSPDLAAISTYRRTDCSIKVSETKTTYIPLGADGNTMDGLNSSLNIIDELHAHPNGTVWTKLTTGESARRQPVTWVITTAGRARESICYKQREYSNQVLNGYPDDTWYAYICCIDDEDKWQDESEWLKANPNLGISKDIGYMRDFRLKAQVDPTARIDFLQMDCGVWVAVAETPLVDPARWALCAAGVDDPMEWRKRMIAELKASGPGAGLDLGAVADLTALALVFRRPKKYVVLPYFWVPRESAQRREEKDGVPYVSWIREGWITPTEGEYTQITDFDQVVKDIVDLQKWFQFAKDKETRKPEINFDRLFQGYQVATDLSAAGFEVFEFGQGYQDMTAPTRRFCELVAEGILDHGNNPVLGWMAGNAAAKVREAGVEKPDKEKSRDRIDGIVATIMALAGVMRREAQPKGSVYETRGVRSL
jgi:phage terminase large subunit-like protein